MNIFHKCAILLGILGIILLLIAAISGELEGGLFLIIPYIKGSGLYSLIGILCFFLMFIFFVMGLNQGSGELTQNASFEEQQTGRKQKSSVKGGGVILIGPIPIVFGSSWKIAILVDNWRGSRNTTDCRLPDLPEDVMSLGDRLLNHPLVSPQEESIKKSEHGINRSDGSSTVADRFHRSGCWRLRTYVDWSGRKLEM